jgi:hypothetical protein
MMIGVIVITVWLMLNSDTAPDPHKTILLKDTQHSIQIDGVFSGEQWNESLFEVSGLMDQPMKYIVSFSLFG